MVADFCEPGQVCVGIPLKNGENADPPDFGKTIRVELLQIKTHHNMTSSIAIFLCKKRNIDMPYA